MIDEATTSALPEGATWIRGAGDSTVRVEWRTPGVAMIRFVGHLAPEMMARTLDVLNAAVTTRSGPFAIVIDAEAQSGYDPPVREAATAWLLAHRERLLPAHILTGTVMVRLGAQMMNVALGSEVFHIHVDRAEFERSVAKMERDSERMRAAVPMAR